MTDNMNDFNTCAALVFQILYDQFPKETEIVIDSLLSDYFDEERCDNYFATIRFLQREGLLRYHELNFGIFSGVVLTAKGLKVLNTLCETFQQESTIAQLITQALANQNQKNLGNIIRELIKVSV